MNQQPEMNMNKKLSISLALVSGLLGLASACKNQQNESKPIRDIPLSRVVRIPAQFLPADTSRAALRQNPGVLTVTPKHEDELPQGPDGFEVLQDGGFVITDPLQRRLVFYDSLGNYNAAWPIGFAANSVTGLANGEFEVRQANSGEIFLFDKNGRPQPSRSRARSRGTGSKPDEARLLDLNRGVIARPRTRGSAAGDLQINFKSDSTQMISLQNLGTDSRGNTYVALEAARGSDAIDVQKIIRKYAGNNELLGQITGIPLDYYLPPVDEFRLRAGRVYQLLPQEKEVLINIWNTNE